MAEDDGGRICPFSLGSGKPLYCHEGNTATWDQEILNCRPCRAWSPAYEISAQERFPDIIITKPGIYRRDGYCMLIQEEPIERFSKDIEDDVIEAEVLVLLNDDEEGE